MAETKCLCTDHNSRSLFKCTTEGRGGLERCRRIIRKVLVIVSHDPTLLLIGNKSDSSS